MRVLKKWVLIIVAALAIILLIIKLIWGTECLLRLFVGIFVALYMIGFLAIIYCLGRLFLGVGYTIKERVVPIVIVTSVMIPLWYIGRYVGGCLGDIESEKREARMLKESKVQIEQYNRYLDSLLCNPTYAICKKIVESGCPGYFSRDSIREKELFNRLDSVYDLYLSLLPQADIDEIVRFIDDTNELSYKSSISERGRKSIAMMDSLCWMLYNNAKKTNTIQSWELYQSYVPYRYYQDSSERIDAIEEQIWKNENKAWQYVNYKRTIGAYKRYIDEFPNGMHFSEVEKAFVRLLVRDYSMSSSSEMPEMSHNVTTSSDGLSTITISNLTDFGLIVAYDGPQQKICIVPASATKSLTIINGRYEVAAQVQIPNVKGFYGVEDLSGGYYSTSFYITGMEYSKFSKH